MKSFLKNVPSSLISGEYLDKHLSTNEFIQNSSSCNKTLLKIYREKSIDQNEKLKIYKEKSEDQKEKFHTSVLIMTNDSRHNNKTSLCHYNLFQNIYLYKKDSSPVHSLYDGINYKKTLYVFGESSCYSYDRDDKWLHRFNHSHGADLRAVALDNSIYIIAGGKDPSGITKYNINTGETEKFNLQNNHLGAGATVIGK